MAMKLYTLDESCLENARAGLKQPFSPLQLALSKLVSQADILRREAPESVVHKKTAAGERRRARLLQPGTYWWPNLGVPTGCRIFAATDISIRSVKITIPTPRALSACANAA